MTIDGKTPPDHALLDRLSKKGITDIIDLSRANVAKKLFGLF